MEIRTKHIAVLVLVVLVGTFIAGYFTAPRQEQIDVPLSQNIVGRFIGKCDCTLDREPTEKKYIGNLTGQFDGRWQRGQNITIISGKIDGSFQGDIFGKYVGRNISGNMDGFGTFQFDGYVSSTKSTGLVIGDDLIQWGKTLLTLLVIAVLMKWLGLVEWIMFRLSPSSGEYIKTRQAELKKELVTYLWNESQIRGMTDIKSIEAINFPMLLPKAIVWVITLFNGKAYSVVYNRWGGFHNINPLGSEEINQLREISRKHLFYMESEEVRMKLMALSTAPKETIDSIIGQATR